MTAMPTPASFAAAPTLPPASVAEDTRLPVTLWELLVWTYGPQRADRLGFGHSTWSRAAWADQLIGMDADGPRPGVHPDAAAVHRVVAGLLDHDVAQLVIEAARTGIVPERSDAKPQPVARRRDGHGGAAPATEGEWVAIQQIRLTRAEREQLAASDDRGVVERWACGGRYRWRYRISLRRAKAVNRDNPPVDQVWSPYCLLDYSPDPAFIAMTNAVADAFEAAILTLDEALGQVPFRTRRIIDIP
ncbi:hypothetical protein ABNQ39_00055 (plasmid) [Azospirillum sp. A26]|uniref:hypothetical protein n=1 Tax=Azospirillum sp. A26 TaxID=3160607 RepID=UPI00366C173A